MKRKVYISFELRPNRDRQLSAMEEKRLDDLVLSKLLKKKEITKLSDVLQWKDCGCCVELGFGENVFSIYLAQYAESHPWECTIELVKYPSFITRLLGKKSDYIEDLKNLSFVIFYWILETFSPTEINICLSSDLKNAVVDPLKLNW